MAADYDGFHASVKEAAEKFRRIDRNESVRLISHLDADGISACSLMVKLLNLDNRKYSLSIVQQMKEDVIQGLAREQCKTIVFSDLASGMIPEIRKHLPDRKVFILDHHELSETETGEDVVLVNPHLFDIDGGNEISGAGVVYLFAKAVEPKMEQFAHIAIIGAMGDMQEDNGFGKLNDEILQEAIKNERVEVQRGLRLFGAQTRPLHKVLEYCTDPYIPGVSGSESGAIQLLHECGINPQHEGRWRKITDLSEEETKNLVAGVIMRRLGETKPEDVLGNVYLLKDEEEGSPTKDVKEFATLLNACGRLGKASLGIGACIGDKAIKERAIKLMAEYKRYIVNAINWYNDNKNTEFVQKGDGYLLINAQDKVMPTIIGTLASIISRKGDVEDGTYILSLAQLDDGSSKVSLRVAGVRPQGNVDLKATMERIVEGLEGCESGGHQHAAGAVLPEGMEERFLAKAKEVLGTLAREEIIK